MSPTRLPAAALLDAGVQRRPADVEQPLRLGPISPIANVYAESATKPPSVTPTSIESTSPSSSSYAPGIPCTTMSFGEAQIDAG